MTMKFSDIPLSLLDLSPVTEGHSVSDAINTSITLARAAEDAGYHRFWMAEHHNKPDIASAATAVLLSHIGARTHKIRIGSGGIMLPNHAPLIIAEQFGTLETLYPGRVDLGIGRASGIDQETRRTLRRDGLSQSFEFPGLLEELQYFLAEAHSGQSITAIPGAGLPIPVWLLGSGTFSAKLAAQKSLPFVFASYFSPGDMASAIDTYRSEFKPSEFLESPFVMVCVNVIAANTQKEADLLATTELQKFLYFRRGIAVKLPKPVRNMNILWRPSEAQQILTQLRESIWGTPKGVRAGLMDLIRRTGANEIMVNSWIHDAEARIYSHQLIADCWSN